MYYNLDEGDEDGTRDSTQTHRQSISYEKEKADIFGELHVHF